MAQRISEVAISANAAWKITNDASKDALLDAALRFVIHGGDALPGKEELGVSEKNFCINLRTNREILDGAPPILAPIARFGDFCVVDRDEIEGYRSVQQLLRDYLQKREVTNPLSIAVFGPPGSGKSYGIQSVAKSVDERQTKLDYNLAQFSDPDQLSSAFLKVRNEATGNRVPIAFFDEFDSNLNGELGWLRYFLAPMQDGEVFFEGGRHKIGKAILVFAGGTTATFRAFGREEGSTEQDRFRFVEAKGPDFVSRLSGHINVLGINRRDDLPDQSFVLRRAAVIRSQLVKLEKIGRQNRALVDEQFISRLLQLGRYKHGARSLTKVLEMCVGRDGQLHLPPTEQLMMHMDKSDSDTLTS